jgi:type IV pilus assembly protein PilW
MSLSSQPRMRSRSLANGFTLVELMVALLLGLIVVGGALAIFSSNKQTYVATENLGRVQENSRVAFELMARDIREAGGNACSKTIPVANMLNTPSARWYYNFTDPIKGYGPGDALTDGPVVGAAVGNRVAGTDAIELKSSYDSGVTLVNQPSAQAATFKVNTVNHGLQDDDIVLICDYRQVTMLQISSASPSSVTIVHTPGAGTPGNCTKGFGFPIVCSANGTPYIFAPGAIVSKAHSTRWYIGNNPKGGKSLYQTTLVGGAPAEQEITEGVSNMSLQYLLRNGKDYVAAASVPAASWKDVLAVRATLVMEGQDKIGTDGNVLSRQLAHVVTLRNRAS